MTREELNEGIRKEINHEKTTQKRNSIIKFTIKTILFLIVFFTLFFAYTTYVSTVKIGVREYRIKDNKLPKSLSGLKIIQFSDLHLGSTMFNSDVDKLEKIINVRNPDIVVFTGDLIDKKYKLNSKEQEKLIKKLKNINASLGKYAILGDEDNEMISTIFNQSDFNILRNEYDFIYKDDNNAILLIGLTAKDTDIEKAYSYFREENHNPDIYTITLSHKPDITDEILSTYKSNLILSGHSHNGDIRIPFINYPIFKIDGAKKYDQDHYKIKDTDLYISSGLGTHNSFRLFCRPTINFFRLSSE